MLALTVALATAACGDCLDGVQPSGALYRFCLPPSWNGDLVVYAHGYAATAEPVALPGDTTPDGLSISGLVNGLGYAFATTSYRTNGLVVLEGIDDVLQLIDLFAAQFGDPGRVFLIGPSEGGILTALAIEAFPDVFDGGLSLCGPVGDFRAQLDYIANFRTLFDYFFPGVIPGNPTNVPDDVVANWYATYEPKVIKAIRRAPDRTRQLIRTSGAPVDPDDPSTVEHTVTGLLWYHVFATENAMAKLGGQPFDNARKLYRGSRNDRRLNRKVFRTTAEPAPLAEIERHYQTSGHLEVPLVTMHTTLDEIIPAAHEDLYARKIRADGSSRLHVNIYVDRYGHCNFTGTELIQGFIILLNMVTRGEQQPATVCLPLEGEASFAGTRHRNPRINSTAVSGRK
ncbi:MAG: prolyl oligopeptidase family serine peptidase [bacterium]